MGFDLIIFDTAPTGHTLKLLKFPVTMEKGLEKMMELREKFRGLLSAVSYGVLRLFGEVVSLN